MRLSGNSCIDGDCGNCFLQKPHDFWHNLLDIPRKCGTLSDKDGGENTPSRVHSGDSHVKTGFSTDAAGNGCYGCAEIETAVGRSTYFNAR